MADGQLATVPALGEAPLPGDTARGDAPLRDSLGAAPHLAAGEAGDTGAGIASGGLPDARGERNGTSPADAASSSPASRRPPAPPSPGDAAPSAGAPRNAATPAASSPSTPAPTDAAPAPAPASPPASAPGTTATRTPSRDEHVRRPFEVGERLTYEVRFGPLAVGTATMQVLDITTVRGIPAFHTRFEVRGGNRLYRVQDRYESWFDTRTLASLRYMQDINEGNYERTSVFEIFPDERRFVEEGKDPQPTVALPLDEGSFIYWIRTIPLEVGQTYSFDRYFRPDRNPVRIEVLRRERVKVPAGTFDAIVVRPVIKTKGIFSEGGRAEIWFADDSTRRIVQMKSRLSFGSLNLYLK